MQHIGLELDNEALNAIERSEINFADILNGAEGLKEHYPWLYSIDPYGLTVFNTYQVPYVVAELKRLSASEKSLERIIEEACAFLEKIGTHEYIKLIGD